MALALDDRERSMLAGDHGEGFALAARLVVRAAEVLGAERLIPITRAHVDSCLYHGEATIDFVQRLVDGEARVARSDHAERRHAGPSPPRAVARLSVRSPSVDGC